MAARPRFVKRVQPVFVRAFRTCVCEQEVARELFVLPRRSWARVIRGRVPVIGLPNADFLRHGPPPAYARGRGAVGGAEPWPQVHPGVVRGARAAAGL